MQNLKTAVIGAGNGGQTFAAHLKQKGHEVSLWNRSKEKLNIIKKNGIELTGVINTKEHLDFCSTDMKEVIKGKEIILVVLPANTHHEIAERIAPYISENQLIILNPGRTAGSVEFLNTLEDNNVKSLPQLVETQSLCYTCRMVKPGLVNLLAIKNNVSLSVMPHWEDKNIIKDLKLIYNTPEIVDSSLEIGLENIGAMLHPLPVLLNIGWIESRTDFIPHYYHTITRTIANLIENMDSERTIIANEYGYSIKSIKNWHGDAYGIEEDNLYDTLQANSVYGSIDAPYNLNHRYIFEDIPTGLVPMSELGKLAMTPTPLMDLMIKLAQQVLGINLIQKGRNADKLGIKGLSVEEIKKVFQGYKHFK